MSKLNRRTLLLGATGTVAAGLPGLRRAWAQGSDDAIQVRERLEAAYPGRTWPVLTYKPSLGVLLGPRALGVMVCEDEVEPE